MNVIHLHVWLGNSDRAVRLCLWGGATEWKIGHREQVNHIEVYEN